jgi:hypothetical protein
MSVAIWLKFTLKRLLVGVTVPEKPVFDFEASTSWFAAELSRVDSYVEYGSGGSTVLAAALGVPFATCDSDRRFLTAVEHKIRLLGYASPERQIFRYAAIGPVAYWGTPVMVNPRSQRRLQAFRQYSDLPCSVEWLNGEVLVLVDGRFRVACTLKAAQELSRLGMHYSIVVDDYTTNESYRCLEQHIDLKKKVGRMAVFGDCLLSNEQHLRSAIGEYELDWR